MVIIGLIKVVVSCWGCGWRVWREEGRNEEGVWLLFGGVVRGFRWVLQLVIKKIGC